MSETAKEPGAAEVAGPERQWLDRGSWVDLWRGWRHDQGATYRELASTLSWSQSRLWRYDHYVIEPRLGTTLRQGAQPVLKDALLLLRSTYQVDFMGPALAYYRD